MYDLRQDYDVIIIGGGPAGLSAAVMLGRSGIHTMVMDDGSGYGSKGGTHFLLSRDGASKSDILRAARQDATAYPSIELSTARAVNVESSGIGYEVELEDSGTVSCAKVIFALGAPVALEDMGIAGAADVLGNGLYTCPFTNGFEQVGKRVAVIGGGKNDPHFLQLVRHWCPNVDYITHDQPADAVADLFASGTQGSLINQKATEFSGGDGEITVTLADGQKLDYDALFISDLPLGATNRMITGLGIETDIHPMSGKSLPKTDPVGRSSLEDVFVIGDGRTGYSTLSGAAQEGITTGYVIANEFIAARLNAEQRVPAL